MFAGQGSQYPGMGHDVFDEFPEHVAQADEVLGYSIRELCRDGERLSCTRFAQPALFVVNVLSYLRFQRTSAVEPTALLGHSLGEYCALHVADVFDFRTGLELVARRGELMAEVSGGAMAAVVGFDADAVHAVLDDWSGELWPAAYNTPEQTVLAGTAEQVRAAKDFFLARGARAYVPLKVSGAFHSPLMATARTAFEWVLARVSLRAPRITVVSNNTAAIYTDRIAHHLGEQLARPCRWMQSIRTLADRGETWWIEIGAKKVLTPMVEKIAAVHCGSRSAG